MKQLFQNLILFFLVCLLARCKEEYQPKLVSTNQSVLVVEGVLNSAGATTIKLSRSLKLADSAGVQPETGAQVNVESKSGAVQALYENNPGTYRADGLALESTDTYRLHIKALDGREYASDFVHVLSNPPIDSINWTRANDGVRLFVTTHNPENNTHYYRWSYDETWELRSAYESQWKLVGYTPVRRQLPEEQVFHCWHDRSSSTLLLGSTANLSSDVVFEKPLIFIPANTEPLAVRYSVLVQQYALDKEGYTFYQLLKKNTESLGSIFDAQPSDLNGNVHSLTNPGELVIGYITATAVQEKRLFISNDELPYWLYSDPLCGDKKFVANNPDSFKKFYNGYYAPYAEDELRHSGYYSAYAPCTDCTLRGGSTQKPSYW